MPLVIPENYANLTLRIRNTGGGISQNNSISIGIKCLLNPWGQGEVNAVSNTCRDALKGLYDNAWELGNTHVIYGTGGVPAVFDDTTVELGTHAADVYAPPNCATIVSKQTGLAGRSKRGRFYLPGVPQGFIGEGGGLNPTHVTTVQAVVNALQTALEAEAAVDNLVLFHDSDSGGDTTPTAITSFLVRTVAGTMRPRLRRA